ncbi:2',5'-phosphodiesterase 12-like [Agrilus planipennis]|uniref:2',5'-phosphodiesterase 12-like n=1 Tax=Agrilus planipennis TaxID=224129 RepID=A0A1W4XHS3_AGRPL|nr:2',5'-phosphodiesterase 12-like [Agrilus planipennis]
MGRNEGDGTGTVLLVAEVAQRNAQFVNARYQYPSSSVNDYHNRMVRKVIEIPNCSDNFNKKEETVRLKGIWRPIFGNPQTVLTGIFQSPYPAFEMEEPLKNLTIHASETLRNNSNRRWPLNPNQEFLKKSIRRITTYLFAVYVAPIVAVRQVKDSVESLIGHTKNKIQGLLSKKGKENVNIKVKITANGKPAAKYSCWDFINLENNVVLQVNEQIYDVTLNAPFVQSVLLPKVLFIENDIVPINLKVIHAVDHMCKYQWHKSKDKINWEVVGNEFRYKPKPDDLDYFLRLTIYPINRQTEGPIFQIISENEIKQLYLPIGCPFEESHRLTHSKLQGTSFRVVCYNILSERYTDDGFTYCPEEYLTIDYRKHLLLNELRGYNADIMCLQEVDLKLLQPFLGRHLVESGYVGVYHRKGNRLSEGLATIYREDRFTIIESKHYVLSMEIKRNPLCKSMWQLLLANNEAKENFLKQATSCQITVFQENFNKQMCLVLNTHLFYRPTDNHIRLIQIGVIMKLIEKSYTDLEKRIKKPPLLILCGDFNSKPPSGVYEFMTKGCINANHPDWKPTGKKRVKGFSLKHQFQLESAYGTPKFTNYVGDFQGCLDYIFYDKCRMNKIQVVPLPAEDILKENVALPSQVFPSDHLALVVDLTWSI